MKSQKNKRKIINDPVYGFIGISSDLIYDLIEHPWFQRLRNIRQLGLTHLVYPGAVHSRFHHALGAMHLAQLTLETLRGKGVLIGDLEAEALKAAVLLHDVGHGPFSHTLEGVLLPGKRHENLTDLMMKHLDGEFDGKLMWARQIFGNVFPVPYFNQLVSGQIDLDRMDYLNRDSFFTGVSEGVIPYDRIIKMLQVEEGRLFVDVKAIYSIEKFLIARRLMYWQVYFHKTVISAEQLLIQIVNRAQWLHQRDHSLFLTPPLKNLFDIGEQIDALDEKALIDAFTQVDDYDLWVSIKAWAKGNDRILALLSKSLVDRNLFHVEIQNVEFSTQELEDKKKRIKDALRISDDEAGYFVFTGTIENAVYQRETGEIAIIGKNGLKSDFHTLSDYFNLEQVSVNVKKHFLCYFRIG